MIEFLNGINRDFKVTLVLKNTLNWSIYVLEYNWIFYKCLQVIRKQMGQ